MPRPKPETQQVDLLFLELSQFTTATTAKELALETALCDLLNASSALNAGHINAASLRRLGGANKEARRVLKWYQSDAKGKGAPPNPDRG